MFLYLLSLALIHNNHWANSSPALEPGVYHVYTLTYTAQLTDTVAAHITSKQILPFELIAVLAHSRKA